MNELKNNFDKKVQMHLACSKEEMRPAMQCIFFNNGFAYATDMYILVRNRISEISGLEPHEIEALNGKFLHADCYKDMLKYDNIMIAEDGIECSKGDNKVFFYFSKFKEYPNAEKVLSEALNRQPTPISQANFDMTLMLRLNKALYKSDYCSATFKGMGNPVVFDSLADDVSSIGLMTTLSGGF